MIPSSVIKPELFKLGRVVATAGVEKWMSEDPNKGFPSKLLAMLMLHQHVTGNWGEVDAEDKKLNDDSVKTGGRLMSSYPVDATNLYEGREDKLWIITEWDRSVTTLLFLSEY